MKKIIFEIIANGIPLILFIIGVRIEMISWLHGVHTILIIIPAVAIFLSKRIFRHRHRFTKDIYYYLTCFIVPFILSLIAAIFVAAILQFPSPLGAAFSPITLISYSIMSAIILILSFIYHKYVSE
ncbi:MAG: hypothetical protein MJB12_09905 [Firmicutes bacterium]|nr:hypothetical protein [Bacillota bacterium]